MSTKGKHDVEPQEPGTPTEKPTITDEHREQAKQTALSYNEERPTTVLPGSHGTISGTAINDWIDDDGNAKGGEDKTEDSRPRHHTV
jgi:secreted protein with Ig-like and vWFA domain